MPGQATRRVPDKPPIAANLRSAQAAAGLTNREVAVALQTTERLLAKWRSGEGAPSWPYLVQLAELLNREPSWFYDEHPDEHPEAAA